MDASFLDAGHSVGVNECEEEDSQYYVDHEYAEGNHKEE
jgi:hypothetical protein